MASYSYTFTSGDSVTPTKLNAARTVSDIVNADIKSDAAIAGSKLEDGAITNAKVSASAAIALSKLATGALPTAITVASANLVDGTIVNADINNSAAIAHSKLANITAGQVLIGNASNVPTATALSGDVTVNSSGVTAIGSGVIVDADVSASAAISLSKLATGALPATITVASSNIVDGTIVNSDISATAAIAGSKISPAFTSSVTSSGDITANGGLVASIADGSSIVRSSRASEDEFGPQMDFRKSRGTQAAKIAVSNGDIIGELRYVAYGGTQDHEGARIRASVDGTPGDADMPGRLQFYTTEDGSSSVTERMRIDNAGRVAVGTASPVSSAQLTVTSTTRGLLPPRMTGTQRDAISAPAAGLMIYNTTTNKLNFYNGTAWEAVTSS